jgi:hypothetical protein
VVVKEKALQRTDRGFVIATLGRDFHECKGGIIVRGLADHLVVKSLLLGRRILRACSTTIGEP